jgi:hypothetical protein
MSRNNIAGKTVRPGSLNGYNYYHSKRQTVAKTSKQKSSIKFNAAYFRWTLIILVLFIGFFVFKGMSGGNKQVSSTPASIATVEQSSEQLKEDNHCQANTLDKFIKVSVEKRTLWACEGAKTVHSTPVITGLRGHAETETPVGTYKIYAKTTNTTLTGQDSRGAWSYPVSYWMPFLDNQYGTYGFHDATWRKDNEFGNTSPDSQKASHGCVELPMGAQKWLYDWARVGTAVTVES